MITELTSAKVLFENRSSAGRKLAMELSNYVNRPVVVLAIPNGGVPMAIEIATALKSELDIIVCRKLAPPLNPEGGLGAVADDGTVVLDEEVIRRDGLSQAQIEYEAEMVKTVVKERRLKYRRPGPSPLLTGKTAILVDDGLASGITMTTAIEAVRHRRPKEIIVAIPVASKTGFARVTKTGTRVVTCAVATMPRFYLADFFRNWQDISDEQTVHSLQQWRQRNNYSGYRQ